MLQVRFKAYLFCFFRKLQPEVNRALPPIEKVQKKINSRKFFKIYFFHQFFELFVGWDMMLLHPWQTTTDWAWLKMVRILKQFGHLTSMKKEFGACTNRFFLCLAFSQARLGWRRSTARGMVFFGRVF